MSVFRSGWLAWMLLYMTAGACLLDFRAAAADSPDGTRSRLEKQLAPLLGERDAMMVSAPDGTVVLSVHPDRALVPASIIKILTGLIALDILGAGYRFPTDFFLAANGDLKIKGYGDPLQVSEQIQTLSMLLSEKITSVRDIILDDSFFAQPISIPGKGRSTEPYDAPNGALCVNFNTVSFKRHNGSWISAEAQTPLLPLVIEKIEASGLSDGRITLAVDSGESLIYAGELYRHFLSQAGVTVTGDLSRGAVATAADRLLWRHESPHDLSRVIESLMAYSNNFIANQLLLAMGAHVYGPPATLEKGLQVLRRYVNTTLEIPSIRLVEASGISRENAISARSMIEVLNRFHPYRSLLRRWNSQWYKTGTLNGIHTRAGYLTAKDGLDYRFVVMLNTAGKDTDRYMRALEQALCR